MQRLGDTDVSHEIESSVSINVPADEKKRSRTFHTRHQGTALEQSQTVKQLSNYGIAAGVRIGQPDEQKENKFVQTEAGRVGAVRARAFGTTSARQTCKRKIEDDEILPDGIFPSGGGDELGRRSDTYTKPPSPMLSYSPAPSPQNSLAVHLFIPTGRTEKAQQDLKVKVAKTELDEWKTTYNTTTTSLQRELDTLKQESQKLKVGLHGLELGNDDLERNERVVASSLADIEARYSKTNLKEELQCVKDELRDSSVEISILKDQLTAACSRAPSILTETSSSTTISSLFPPLSTASSDDNLLSTPPPPPDLEPSDHSSNEKFSIPTPTRPPFYRFQLKLWTVCPTPARRFPAEQK
ncbi:hypothetical protein F4604DRAFT_1937111 [Suillus subluteus]|nr:hypothetical protein F4604DRAFT_1937111 [Suillus subluteus]